MSKAILCPGELLQKDLRGTHVVITGANSGIGFVTAKQLASQGAFVVMACRRIEEGEERAKEIRAAHAGAKVEVRALDLASLDSVRAFAAGYQEDYDKIDILINNAGVMNTKEGKTKDGFEMQFGVNHLGHFLLTETLLDMLVQSSARVVILSSCFHDHAMGREGHIDLGDLQFEEREYDGWTAYAQSKLANLLHAKTLAARHGKDGLSVVSVHPGWVRTKLARHTTPVFIQDYILRPIFGMMGMISPWQGAQTSLFAALSDDIENGAYYSQTGHYRDKSKNGGGWPLVSPNPAANDAALADGLYQKSKELLHIS